ncbi:unnamed protein product [Polarella glacialis]|uniref:RING-type domain-containing protein n=1 Tax=Polarella glacialis TaxID=89957 RepID=A0A813JDU5_POLGL|nr:unnamed protein product [Polarella glacialis]
MFKHCFAQPCQALLLHADVCLLFQERRQAFEAAAQRRVEEGAGAAETPPSESEGEGEATDGPRIGGHAAGSRWRQQSDAFQEDMRGARQAVAELRAEQPSALSASSPPQSWDDLVECPHCNRRFCQESAQRHVPRCSSTNSRPTRLVRRLPVFWQPTTPVHRRPLSQPPPAALRGWDDAQQLDAEGADTDVEPAHRTRSVQLLQQLAHMHEAGRPVAAPRAKTPGLSPEELNLVKRNWASAAQLEAFEVCAICLDGGEAALGVGEVVMLPCRHMFCRDCICEWLTRRSFCVLCKQDVRPGLAPPGGRPGSAPPGGRAAETAESAVLPRRGRPEASSPGPESSQAQSFHPRRRRSRPPLR